MKMYYIRHFIVRVLLHCSAVLWCGAMHLPVDGGMRVRFPDDEVASEIKTSISSIIHTGIYSHLNLDPERAEVITPVKVTREGNFVSHSLSHTHEHGHARARRDLSSREHTMDHTLHYNITVDGRDLRLDLRPSVSFMTPSMVIERHAGDHRTRSPPAAHATACHYTGSVRGQPASAVALSACDGLAGLLRTEHGEYWIEPSNQLPTDEFEGRSHVIFKRSAVNKEDAWHRARQAQNRKTEAVSNNGRLNRKEIDQNRYNEYKRKRIEELRRNSSLHRRQQAVRRRFDQRKANKALNSLSFENLQRIPANSYLTPTKHNAATRKMSRPQEKRQRGQKNRMQNRRRRRRKAKECATKQPPYPWKNKNSGRGFDASEVKELRHNKTHRRYPHHHQLSQRNDFYENRRSPRSVSKPQHVEVLLVADKSMTDFHNSKGSLETYLLTIMNMVSSLYMDPSIGNYIKVVVVKIILVVDSESPDLVVSSNADYTLSSFCRWQQRLNPDDDNNPHHHDVAILVTRQDICSRHDAPCSTLGVAHVAGMCKPDRSCSVNEDNGITLAHTITHELGHNFGLYHDTEKIGCHRREGTTLHIMTPIFEADTVEVAWSRCSKRDVTNFLDAGLGECLGDQPSQEEYVYPEQPAGVMFDAATQCHLQFGSEAAVCAEPGELCQHLWCLVNGTCKTMLRPAAPGTSCGPDMWCQGQSCVARAPAPRPRDGGWGAWGAWSPCSRTCGAGVSTQTRECDTPQPEHNGKYCIGERSRYKICNTDPCPITEPSFREIQCSKFKNKKINNETIEKWIPYFDQDRPCELSCVAQERNDLELNGGFVLDGTPCRQSLGARDLCVAGVCHKVGCDWIVDSDMEEDACGVCGGDGSACKTVQGIYNKGTTKQTGFSEVAVIPAGSRNVKIQEKVNPGNYISIGSAKTKRVYLSGKRNATLTEYLVAGSPAIYERDRDWEKVRIPGPITEDIKVYQRIYRGRHRNPGVTYQYTVDRQPSRRRWKLSEWSPCSASCGIGYSRQRLVCVDDNDQVVEEAQCYNIESPQHAESMKQCRIAACPTTAPPPRPAHWWLSPWSACSPACNMPGREAMKQRNVYCVDNDTNSVIEEHHCYHVRKPDRTMPCANLPPC